AVEYLLDRHPRIREGADRERGHNTEVYPCDHRQPPPLGDGEEPEERCCECEGDAHARVIGGRGPPSTGRSDPSRGCSPVSLRSRTSPRGHAASTPRTRPSWTFGRCRAAARSARSRRAPPPPAWRREGSRRSPTRRSRSTP